MHPVILQAFVAFHAFHRCVFEASRASRNGPDWVLKRIMKRNLATAALICSCRRI